MCLTLQGTSFQVQVLKPYKSVQETSEKVLDFKVWQLASIKIYEKYIFDSVLHPMRMCLGFLLSQP